jgi:NADH:ubiquinone oxidoreductase subunit E
LKVFKALIDAHEVGAEVNLAADLCLDNCLQAPNVVIDGKVFGGISPDKAEEFFLEQILGPLGRASSD